MSEKEEKINLSWCEILVLLTDVPDAPEEAWRNLEDNNTLFLLLLSLEKSLFSLGISFVVCEVPLWSTKVSFKFFVLIIIFLRSTVG